ncbi:MAG: pyridoxal phosphate-dependent aminotransferase [Oscillospiraceae bacterium]|nr:pyridoxal phosphate-dependent aminotransferase [Oscillospiraceae bacterium]
MKELSKIYSAVAPSATMAVDAKYKQMKADGLPVVGFGAGEPDFDTPDYIKAAGIAAIENGQTKYTPAAGTNAVRQAVAYRIKEDTGVDFDWTNIVVSSGAKACLYTAFTVLLNPGDEVIIPAPYWVSFTEQIKMAGGVPVVLETGEEQRFKITAEQLAAAVTEKTKAIVLNNPSNPTGMIYGREELAAIADVCVKNDLYIVADEIYCKLVYDGFEFTSVASLGEEVKKRCILINGASKSYAMTGWRCGYAACGDKKVARTMANVLSHSIGGIGTMNQAAMTAALRGPQDSVEAMRKVFEERRNYMVSRMNAMDGVSCLMPNGAFYVMMNISRLIGRTLGGRVINSADDFAMAFLESGLVAVVSCDSFGISNFIRWTYASSMESIKEGMDRLEKFLQS